MTGDDLQALPAGSAASSRDAATRGIAILTFAFALSQFFRSCLAVMAPELQHDFGLSPAGFGALSSSFFLAFAIAQIPVGIAFDRYGVGKPTALLLAVGAVSSILFVAAPTAPWPRWRRSASGWRARRYSWACCISRPSSFRSATTRA